MANAIEIVKTDRADFDLLVNKKIVHVTLKNKVFWPLIEGAQQFSMGGQTTSPYREQTLRSALYEQGVSVAESLVEKIKAKELKIVNGVLQLPDGTETIDIGKTPKTLTQAIEFGLLPPDVMEGRAIRGTGSGGGGRHPKARLSKRIEQTDARIVTAKNRVTELQKLRDELQKQHDELPEDPPAGQRSSNGNGKNGKIIIAEREKLMECANLDSLKKIAKNWKIKESEYKDLDKAEFIELILKTEHPNHYVPPVNGTVAEAPEQTETQKAPEPTTKKTASKKASQTETSRRRKTASQKKAEAKAKAEAQAEKEAHEAVVAEIRNASQDTRGKMIANMDLLNLATVASGMGIEVVPGMTVDNLRTAIVSV